MPRTGQKISNDLTNHPKRDKPTNGEKQRGVTYSSKTKKKESYNEMVKRLATRKRRNQESLKLFPSKHQGENEQ